MFWKEGRLANGDSMMGRGLSYIFFCLAMEYLIVAASVGSSPLILFSLLSGTKLLGETGCAGWRVQLLLARRWLQRFCCGGRKFGE